PAKKDKSDTTAQPSSVGGIEVQLLADGKPLDIREASEGEGVKWQVTSPAPGQQITFRLKNNSARQLGGVLRLNGGSTIDQEKGDPEKCRKFVINPGKFTSVKGFLMLGGEGEKGRKAQLLPFKILVGAEAKKAKEEMADKAGLIEVDVFEEGNEEQPP